MGYCYDDRHRLCCDECGASGETRKYPCPFGYCPPVALCPKCRTAHPEFVSKVAHREQGCEKNHLRFQAEEAERQRMLDAGLFLRCSALSHGNRVKVVFDNKARESQAWWMSRETYHGIPILKPATIEDYRKLGPVERAKSTEIHDAEAA